MVAALAACDPQRPETNAAGNAVPASQAWQLESVAVVTAGDENPFLHVTSITADGDGNVYVLDNGAPNIRVFDSTGSAVRTIGRHGRGPGEFGRPSSLAWVGDSLAVYDPGNGRIEVVSPDGAHLASWPGARASGSAIRLRQAGPSRIFTRGYQSVDGQLRPLYLTAGPTPSPDTLRIPQQTEAGAATGVSCLRSDGGITFFDIPFASRSFHTVSPEGFLVTSRTGEYRFTWTDPAGTARRIMAFGADPLPIPDQAWDSLRAEYKTWRDGMPNAECEPGGLERPPARPAFRAVEFDDEGRMWVEATTESGYRFDVWEPASGTRFGSFPAPERDAGVPFVVRGGRLYVAQSDAAGEQSVHVYRIAGDSTESI